MGIYDEQIKTRIRSDADDVNDSFLQLASVITGERPKFTLTVTEHSKNAIADIMSYFGIKAPEVPDHLTDINDQLDFMLTPVGVMWRVAHLTTDWHTRAIGAKIATLKDTGEVVALIPRALYGYSYYDTQTARYQTVTRKISQRFAEPAISLFPPLPLRPITAKDFLVFFIQSLSIGDLTMLAAFTLCATLIGLISPYITNQLFKSTTYTTETVSIVIPALTVLIGSTISAMLFSASAQLTTNRIVTKSGVAISAAMMGRLLSLPVNFFKGKSTGDISSRLSVAENVCNMFIKVCVTTTLTTIFSLCFIGQIFFYAPSLLMPAIFVMVSGLLISSLTSIASLTHQHELMNLQAQEKGMVYSLFRGVAKIKITGSQARAFAKWSTLYKRVAARMYAPPFLVKFSSVLTLGITSFGTILIYYFAITTHVSMPDFMAFNVAYGQVSSAFMALISAALSVSTISIHMRYMQPILAQMPESGERKKIVTDLTGYIELNNISFRYHESMPPVLNDISLKIRPHQSIAIVGKSGCGKSTLLRLLLGFETPEKGAIYYDGKDLQTIEKKSLRRHIGVVPQDGKLFAGNIFSNISISAPNLSADAAWEALKIAAIADDIQSMPMGIHTIISEGGGGISTGQKHRLMIARAVATKPKILFLDEATCSLDNITQKHVTDELNKLRCTKIIIAHRLSTIRYVDRILVLDGGRIVEDGTFDALMTQGGLFAELMKRQQT